MAKATRNEAEERLARWIHEQQASDRLREHPVGRRVRKIGGSYQHTGVVLVEFWTRNLQRRLVVEFDPPVAGMLHILRPDQVEVIEE